jgi:PAS domain-containing protein
MLDSPGIKELEQKVRELEEIIQAQKQKEAGLLEEISKRNLELQYYDTLMQNTEDFILICDREGKALAYNKSFKSIMEMILKKEVKPGIQPYMAGPPEAIKVWSNLREKVLKGEKFKTDSAAKTDKGDSYFETIFCPVRKGEEVTGFIEITRNTTEYKLAEVALKESNAFSISLLDNSPNAMLVINPDSSIRYANPFFEKLTGYLSSEIIGQKMPYPWWGDDPDSDTIEGKKKTITYRG